MYEKRKDFIDSALLVDEFNKFVSCDSLGFYNFCEMISVFLVRHPTDNSIKNNIHNVFTLFCFDEVKIVEKIEAFLTKKLIQISREYSLGIKRQIFDIDEVKMIYKDLCNNRDKKFFKIGEVNLNIGKLEGVSGVFVQEDSTIIVPLNRILKNNFHNGSYILEFFDIEKNLKKTLDKEQYKKLTDKIHQIIPLDLFSLEDRLGNIIFQFPSYNSSVNYTTDTLEQDINVKIEIDKRIKGSENFLFLLESMVDNTVIAQTIERCILGINEFKKWIGNSSELIRVSLIDMDKGLIISRRESTFIRSLQTRMEYSYEFGEQRIIYENERERKIDITSEELIEVSEPIIRHREDYIKNRRYKERIDELDRNFEFRRYGRNYRGHKEGVDDLINLINNAGKATVYIWDPYLTTKDVVDIWYSTKTFGAKLRAITSDVMAKQLGIKEWIKNEAEYIDRVSNHYGIDIEIRCQIEGYGYKFHDRFLMIQKKGTAPRVWSLGTSVNSIGKKHHVIQSISHPQLLIDAFEDLWKDLDVTECLVWRKRG